ncbi:MAG TPA: alanine racemase [Acidimicrobiia bacterium]
MSSPRIDVDLDRIGQNAQELVRRAAARGVTVTAITKAMRGLPALGRVVLEAGAVALGDSRVEHIERLRADGIDAPIVLIRSALVSEVDRVVVAADTSCATEVEIVELLSAAAVRADRVHGIILMVELGDLREGIMPADLADAIECCLAFPNIEIRGIGTNLACRNGVVPDDRNMGELSDLATAVEAQFGFALGVVSGGNSSTLDWLGTTEQLGRIDNLRLGEAILLGRDPLHSTPIAGLHHDAATIFAEVIESKHKPRRAWGARAQSTFAPPVDAPSTEATPTEATPAEATTTDEDHGWHSLLAIGHQDTDPLDLSPPPGLRIIGASSDHLVIASQQRLSLGSEVAFRPGYSALVRAMSSRTMQSVIRGGPDSH